MGESENAKANDLEYLRDFLQKLHAIEPKQFRSVSEMLNVLTEELGIDAVRAINIDSTNGKLTVVVKTQKAIRMTRHEMELTLQLSESQPNESKEDSPQKTYRIDKIRYTKCAAPLCSIIPIILLVFLLILLLIVGCSGN